VDDAVNFRVLGENLIDGLLVCDVDLVKGRAAAANQLNAIEGDLGGVVEGVNNNDIVTVLKEGEGGERTNVSGTTEK
jgi:hypothetical protein